MDIIFWILSLSLVQVPPASPGEAAGTPRGPSENHSPSPPVLPRSLSVDELPLDCGRDLDETTETPVKEEETWSSLPKLALASRWSVPSRVAPPLSNAPSLLANPLPWVPPGRPQGSAPSPVQKADDGPHDSVWGFLDSHFSSTAWRENVVHDYLTEPPVLFPLTVAAGAAAVSPWDHTWSQHFQGKMGGNSWIADGTSTALVVGAVFLGAFFPGEGRNWWDELWNEGECFAIANGTTSVIKVLAHRHRPGPGGRNQSFPSGHSTNAFTAAALIDHNSGSLFGWPAYGIASVTALSRIDTGDHFPSDVLAGAAVGIFTVGILDALHFGTGREGRGISGPPVDFEMGFGHGVDLSLGLSLRF